MRIAAALLILFTFAQGAFAKGAGGVAFDVALGSGGGYIKNPDESKAGYKILSVAGRGVLPLFESDNYDGALTGGLKYLDLTNTANNSDTSEVANMIGPNAGVKLRLFKFFVGYEYNMMLARHYTIGTISRATKYNLPLTTLNAGLVVPFNQLSVSLSYSQSSGKVPKSGTGLSKDVPYQDQILWLQLTYSTGASFQKFLGFLF